MKEKIGKFLSFCLSASMILVFTAYVYPVRAINVNVNQDTFVLSNEAPGYGISALVNAGYGNMNLYQTLVQIVDDSDPSVSGILTPQFIQTLRNAPASAQIFTTKLKDVNSQGATIGISTDGTFLTNGVIVGLAVNFTTLANGDISGSTYYGSQGSATLNTFVSGAGSFRIVYENKTVYSPTFGMNITAPLTSWTVNGPLAGMTTTYNVFGILYMLSATTTSSTPASTTIPTLSPPASSSTPTSTSSPKVNPSSMSDSTPTSNTSLATTPSPQPTSIMTPETSLASSPSAPEFSPVVILFSLLAITVLVATLFKRKVSASKKG